MRKKVVGLGAGGHCKVVIDILRRFDAWEIVGLLDRNPDLHGREILGVPVLGGDSLLGELKKKDVHHFFLGLGSTGDTRPRRALFELATDQGMSAATAVHPDAIVSPYTELGQGLTVMPGAVINADVRLGVNVIVNSGAIVEHDCIVGDHSHVASGARLASTVKVGDGVHIGAGATVIQCLRISDGSIIGAGSVVLEDVPPYVTVVGSPARSLPKTDP